MTKQTEKHLLIVDLFVVGYMQWQKWQTDGRINAAMTSNQQRFLAANPWAA